MTKEEAIKRIKDHMQVHKIGDYPHIYLREALDMSIEALEKQIPKSPDLEGDGYDDSGNLIYDTGYCPNCNHIFEVDYDATQFCPNCGQALDWDWDQQEAKFYEVEL